MSGGAALRCGEGLWRQRIEGAVYVVEGEKDLNAGTPEVLDNLEKDTIGEILNISMGAAATAVSTMLDRKVDITTPMVSVTKADVFECQSLEPAIGIEIEYLEGLTGSNILVLRLKDIRAIVNTLLGEESDINSGEPLNEMHRSAAGEIMNQMMGAASTSLASFFGKSINISTPQLFEISELEKKIVRPAFDEYVVSVRFILKITDLLDSEFVTVMPMSFTKELVMNAMRLDEPASEPSVSKPKPTAPAPRPAASVPKSAAAAPQPAAAAAKPAAAAPKPAASPRQPVSVRPVQLQNFDDEPTYIGGDEPSGNLGLVMGVPLEVSVEIGKTRMSVKEILEIRQGSLIELDRQAGDPVDIMVNGQLIARGDVVIIDDDFGVRVTEILSEKGRMPG